jgi:hypothetical protein
MVAVADPTIELLKSLDDPTRFVVRRGVPIFKPHRRVIRDRAGNVVQTIVVTEKDLPRIAARMRAAERSGTLAVLTEGHRKGGNADERTQPRVFGYSRNARVGTFGPTNEPAILVDECHRYETWNESKHLPFRSPDYYPETDDITGVAALVRDPFLKLGVVAYHRGVVVRYELEDSPMAGDNLLPPTTDDGAGLGDDMPPEGHDQFCANMAHYEKSNPWVGHARTQYEAASGPSEAAGANAMIPGLGDGDGDEPEALRMQRDSQAVRYQNTDARVKALEAKLAKAESEAKRSKAERQLVQLEAIGYELNRALEVNRMAAMPESQWPEHVQYIRDFHRQSAVGAAAVDIDGRPAESNRGKPGDNQIAEDESKAIVRYATEHGLTDFKAARVAYMAERNGGK